MACCVVLNHRPQDVGGDDPPDNASCASPKAHPSQRPNPGLPMSCSTSASVAAMSAPPSAGLESGGDHGTSSNVAPDFKEPWSKLVSLAKAKCRQSHSKPKEASIQTASAFNQLDKLDRNQDENSNIPNSQDNNPSKTGIKPVAVDVQPSLASNKSDNKVSSEDTSQLQRASRATSQVKRKSRSRASSVEWDYSGSESAHTSSVPQCKRKTSKRRKRNASIEMDWAASESDSDCSDSKSDFDSFHQCSICKKKFRRPWRLRVHLEQHLQPEIRPFKCDEDGCSKGYFYKTHLDRHKSRSHSDLVILTKTICPSVGCNRMFESQGGLKRHINKVHSVENLKFHCPHCDKKFNKSKQLRFHIAEHNGEPPLRCEKCDAGVFSANELKRHMRTHKEYPCDVSGCEKVFLTYPAFQKHKAEHNKCFQSLKCAHCNREFKKKSDLRNHVMTHLDQKKIFKCTYDSCPRFYYQERNLNSHIRIRHERTSNFVCNWEDCEMQFLCKKALTRHLNVHVNGKAEPRRKKETRAQRKDKGKHKRAMATQLAGMLVHREVEKALLATDRVTEICDFKDEASPRSISSVNANHSSQLKRSKLMKKVSTSETPVQNKSCSADSVNIINQDNVVTVQDHSSELPCKENSRQIFEIGEGGVLIEVDRETVSDESVMNSDPNENHHLLETGSSVEKGPKTGSMPEIEQKLNTLDEGAALDLGEIPIIFEGVVVTDSVDDSNEGLVNGSNFVVLQAESNELPVHTNQSISNCVDKRSETGEACAEMYAKSSTLPAKRSNGIELEKRMVTKQIDGLHSVTRSNAIPDCEEEDADSETNSHQGPSRPSTDSTDVNLVNSQNEFENIEEYGSGCILSATLCAETIIDGPQGEREVFLLIPEQKLAANEASSAAVVKALSGDMEVYSVAGSNASGGLSGGSSDGTERSPVKRVPMNDPSVTSILQPLIEDLAKKSGLFSSGVKSNSKTAKQQIRNPAYTNNVIWKLAKFICTNSEKVPFEDPKYKRGRSLKGNLQGPTEQPTQSDGSSGSESDHSRSDSGSDDDHNDFSEDEADDNLSSGGDDGNDGDDDGDDEDEVDEQPDDEDSADDEDDDDENDEDGNNGAVNLNGDDNNNNDNNESNSERSEDQADHESTNGHQHVNYGSDLGVDRASSPKENILDENDDDVRSTHSDDLIIDVQDDEDEKAPADKVNAQEIGTVTSTKKSSPKCEPSPEEDFSKVRQRSSRLKKAVISEASQEKLEPSFDAAVRKRLQDVRNQNHHSIQTCAASKSLDKLIDKASEQHRAQTHSKQGKLFICGYDSCPRKYVHLRNLQSHIKVVHEKTSRFSCKLEGCEKQFFSSKALDSHHKSHKNMSVVESPRNVSKKNHACTEQIGIKSVVKKTPEKKQQTIRTALKRRRIKSTVSAQKKRQRRSKNSQTSESDSSGSDIVQAGKKRRCNISDDSDSSVNMDSNLNLSVKEETDAINESPKDLKSPLHISLGPADMNQFSVSKSLPPSQDPLHIPAKNKEISFFEPKMESRTAIACSQLSEQAWIRVLRQASKVMKLSLTAAED